MAHGRIGNPTLSKNWLACAANTGAPCNFVYTLDTNAVLYYLRNDSAVVSLLEQATARGEVVNLSVITEAELFSFPALSAQEEAAIERLLLLFPVMLVDSRVAREAGSLRREYRLKLPDSLIAATALILGSSLITRNVKDFKKIRNLSIIAI